MVAWTVPLGSHAFPKGKGQDFVLDGNICLASWENVVAFGGGWVTPLMYVVLHMMGLSRRHCDRIGRHKHNTFATPCFGKETLPAEQRSTSPEALF